MLAPDSGPGTGSTRPVPRSRSRTRRAGRLPDVTSQTSLDPSGDTELGHQDAGHGQGRHPPVVAAGAAVDLPRAWLVVGGDPLPVDRGLGEGVLGHVLGLLQVTQQGEDLADDTPVGRRVERLEAELLAHVPPFVASTVAQPPHR